MSIYQKTAKLQALELIIKQYLPEHIAKSITVSSFEQGILIIASNNSVANSELRYLLPSLRTKLRNEKSLFSLTSIKQINS